MIQLRWAIAALALLPLVAATGDPPAANAEADFFVSPDAYGFTIFRTSDVVRNPAGRRLYDLFKKDYDIVESFVGVSLLDAEYVVQNQINATNTDFKEVTIVRSNKPIDKSQSTNKDAKKLPPGKWPYEAFESKRSPVSFPVSFYVGDHIAGNCGWLPRDDALRILDRLGTERNELLTEAIAETKKNHAGFFGFFTRKAKFEPKKNPGLLERAFEPISKSESIMAWLDIDKEIRFECRVRFATEAEAKEGEKSINAVRGVVLTSMLAMLFDNNPPKTRVERLFQQELSTAVRTASVRMEDKRVLISAQFSEKMRAPDALADAFAKARKADDEQMLREKPIKNFNEVGLAQNGFESANDWLPTQAIYSRDNQPVLSWRVALLPYIEHGHTYQKFKLNESWESDENRKLIPQIPDKYVAVNAPPAKKQGLTYVQVFVGGGAVFNASKDKVKRKEITDGLANTIFAIEAADHVVWTKPADIDYDPQKPLPKFGVDQSSSGFMAVMCDGSVRTISRMVSDKTMRALITRAGSETIDDDWKLQKR